jgi:hypothetical protein
MPVQYRIVSTAPTWFFGESLTASYTLYPLQTDVGLVQHDALREDLESTLQQLDAFYPLRPGVVNEVAQLFADCQLVLCDIAPLGIAAAAQARKEYGATVQSVLLENFTWDWIYQAYLGSHPRFSEFIQYLRQLYHAADYHIQAQPVCAPEQPDLVVGPIARSCLQKGTEVRAELGLSEQEKVILVTMGGIAGTELPLEQMRAARDFCFVLPGQEEKQIRREGNILFLPSDSAIRHPDLIGACDAVIGKIGYSTLAEVYQAGIPFAFISREWFRESRPLADFIAWEMPFLALTEEQLYQQDLSEMLTKLCRLPQRERKEERGGTLMVAEFLQDVLSRR